MAAETHYTSNTGLVRISTANSNLDGSGTLGTVLTGASNGTLIKRVIVKAIGTGANSTTKGMVRLFVDDSTHTRLLEEIPIPEMSQSSTDPTFETIIDLDFKLESGYILKASTENSESFNVIAEGLDVSYYASSVRPESTNYEANTGSSAITAQNSNLDGSGTLATLITATTGGPPSMNGLLINEIRLKAYTDVSRGMIRLYIQNTGTGSSNTFLFREVDVIPTVATGSSLSFECAIAFHNPLQIEAGYKIVGSIESSSGENVAVTVDAMDWEYPS